MIVEVNVPSLSQLKFLSFGHEIIGRRGVAWEMSYNMWAVVDIMKV